MSSLIVLLRRSSCLSLQVAARQQQQQHNGRLGCCVWWWQLYHTRAHPKAKPVLPIPDALERLLQDGAKRKQINVQQDDRLNTIVEKKGKQKRSVRGYPDETIELALNLNLDPRQPGQSLRGNLTLPHGTGKPGPSVLVFTTDSALQDQCRAVGAKYVGGAELVEQVLNGTVSPGQAFTVALATIEMIPILQSLGAARILGPRKLMPNVKSGTAVESPDAIVPLVEAQLSNKLVEYRTESQGSVHLPVGKQSFGTQKLLENIGAVMSTIYHVKPDAYGKGKKKKSKSNKNKTTKQQPIYLLSAFLSSTQGKGLKLDLRTVDPTSPFFLSDANPLLQVAVAAKPTTTTTGSGSTSTATPDETTDTTTTTTAAAAAVAVVETPPTRKEEL